MQREDQIREGGGGIKWERRCEKKRGISAPEIIGKLSPALCSERRLLPFGLGNNLGQRLTIPIHGVFHGII